MNTNTIKAEKLFEDRFKAYMKGQGGILSFKRDYPTLYNKVIIPLLEEQISKSQVANVYVDACIQWERLMMELVGVDGPGSVRQAINKLKTENQLTKREHLAGYAISGLAAHIGTAQWSAAKMAEKSVLHADELLKALNK
jgi:hypothetical protein